jgi:hypothetical protein
MAHLLQFESSFAAQVAVVIIKGATGALRSEREQICAQFFVGISTITKLRTR